MVRRNMIPVAAMLFLAAGAGGQEPGGAKVEKPEVPYTLPFDTVKLIPADLNQPATMMRALKHRRSTREFDTRSLPLRQLSELLWAANGVNRDDGKRTAPAAVNQQTVDIYVIVPNAAFLYDAPNQRLVPVAAGDFRRFAGRQEFVATAPLNFVYVADPARFKLRPGGPAISTEQVLDWACIATGAMAQNVGLYCAAVDLGNVVRAGMDKEQLGPALKLGPDQVVLLAQTIGHPQH